MPQEEQRNSVPGTVPAETTGEAFLRGVRTSLPMNIGFVPLAFILGAQGGQHGLSGTGMALMTGLNFAGGSEFAAVALWSAAPSFLVIFMTTWLINSRHIVLGATLTPHMARAGVRTPAALLAFFLMCDECWAVSMQEIDRRRRLGMPEDRLFSLPFHLGAGFTLWTNWWLCAGAGAVLGSTLGDLTQWGFLMAFPATFIALSVAMRPALSKCLPVVVSGVVAALASFVLPMHWCILAATLSGVLTAAVVPELPVGTNGTNGGRAA